MALVPQKAFAALFLLPATVSTSTELNDLALQVNVLKDGYTKLDERIKKLETPPTPPASNVYDDYSTLYDLKTDNSVSPNSKWRLCYTGYNPSKTTERGQSGVRTAGTFYAYPYSTVNSGTGTNATLTLSETEFTNFDLTFNMRTKRSLKATPNSWETAWLLFRFNTAGFATTDHQAHFHHYYFLIKRNGAIEFGRKDNTTQLEEQTFLSTNQTVTYADNKWFKIRIKAIGNKFTIWIDDVQKIDLTDDGTIGTRTQASGQPIAVQPPSTFMSKGRLGIYAEDAEAEYGPFAITPL